MIGGNVSAEAVPAHPIASPPGELGGDELERLWEVFAAIGRVWWPGGGDPLYQRSQWLEFIGVKCGEEPSYRGEYRNALVVLAELKQQHRDDVWDRLFFNHGVPAGPPLTRLAHFRVFVVEEFIKVWLTTGGFRAFGAGNYNSFVSGSRFAVKPAYRRVLPVAPPPPSPPASPTSPPNPQPED